METETIDRLFLELSQVTGASTAKEIFLTNELCRLTQALDEALNTMRAYAAANPLHDYKGLTQDPNGVHAWLQKYDRGRGNLED